jgi:hypothetical protein
MAGGGVKVGERTKLRIKFSLWLIRRAQGSGFTRWRTGNLDWGNQNAYGSLCSAERSVR